MASTTITVTVDTVDYIYTLDSVTPDGMRYLDPASTLLLPSTVSGRRVYPKRQKTFPGVARNELKTSEMYSFDDGTSSPIIFATSVSRRADVATADFTLLRKKHAMLLLDGELDGFFNNLSI
jgi:hypothetical protein